MMCLRIYCLCLIGAVRSQLYSCCPKWIIRGVDMFREEVVSQQVPRLEGRVLLVHSGSLLFWILIFLILFALAITFVAKANYSKKKVTQGYIVSSKAMARYTVNKHSIVSEVFVKEGELVKKGQRLVRLQSNLLVNDGGVSSVSSTEGFLSSQLDKIKGERQLHADTFEKRLRQLKLENTQLQAEMLILKDQQELSNDRKNLAESMLGRALLMSNRGFLTQQDLEQLESKLIDAKTYLKQNQQKLIAIKRTQVQLSNREQDLKHSFKSKLLDLERQRSQLKSDLVAIQSETERYILAKEDGIVSNFLSREGEYAKPGASVLDVRPVASNWQALLLLPSNSSGEIRRGQHVAIRLDAFPYQRFGTLKGTIKKVDQTLAHPDEVRMELRSQSAVYRVWVDIDRQFLSADDKKYPLRQGMRLSADVVQERRTLLAWLLGSFRSSIERL